MKPQLTHIQSIADSFRHPVSGEFMGQRKVFPTNGYRTIAFGKCELQSSFHIINKNELKMSHRLTCKRTINYLEENTVECLCDFKVNKDFLGHKKHKLWKKKMVK